MRIVDYRGKWCALVRIDGQRRRLSLGNLDVTGPPERCPNYPSAVRAAADLERQLAQPVGDTCQDIWTAYLADIKAIDKERLRNAWKALQWKFGPLRPDQITRQVCREYVAERTAEGRAAGTIRKELTAIRAAVNWHNKASGAVFELPSPPDPKDRWLTRAEFARLLKAAEGTFHLTVFLHLAIATAGRKQALLQMTWHQVRWDRGEVWLGKKEGGKNRATVPMNATLKAVLQQAKAIARTEHVIEYEDAPVKSIRTAFAAAVRRAKLKDVTPHVLRHSAGVWMAEAGVPMAKIAQYMGHSDSRITERVYARFAPEHLADAAGALDVGTTAVVQTNPNALSRKDASD